MTIERIIMSFGFAVQMLICLSVALPLKRKKVHLLYVFPIIFVWYIGVLYFSKTDNLWWIAYLMESFGALFFISYCDTGNVWRNYMIVWIVFQISNVIFTAECTILNLLHVKSSYILVYSSTDTFGVIVEDLIVILDTYLVASVVKRMFKKKYEGDGGIYRILFFLILFLGTLYGYVRERMIKDYVITHRSGDSSDIYVYLFIVVGIILIGNILVYVYNRLEIVRLEKIKTELQTVLSNNSEQYRELAKKNNKLATIKESIAQYKENLQAEEKNTTIEYFDELCADEAAMPMLPLSGCVAVDAILSTYYKQYGACGMVFEFHVEQLAQIKMADIDAAVLFDNLLKVAKAYCDKTEGEGWTLLNTKTAGEDVVIKLEFSKSKEDKLESPKRFSIIKRAGESGNEIRVVRKITQLYHGMLDVSDMGEEAAISLLIQGHAGE